MDKIVFDLFECVILICNEGTPHAIHMGYVLKYSEILHHLNKK